MDTRPTWDATCFDIARIWSKRATCPRLSCGAIVVDADRQVLTAGYNGSPRGLLQCDQVGCLMDEGHCIRAVHAEMNALIQAARVGVSLKGCALYATHSPCPLCAKLIIQAGIVKVHFAQMYTGWEASSAFLHQAGVEWEGRA